MKTVYVAAAVIQKDGRILATQRGYGDYKDGWEFPGGKIEPGESAQEAAIREIREELDIRIDITGALTCVEYEYPAFRLCMQCFWAVIREGEPVLREHEAAKWLDAGQLDSVDWLPADREILPFIQKRMAGTDGQGS